jgi:site-specific DNA-cytosine methylase
MVSGNFSQNRPNGSPRITTTPEGNEPFDLLEPERNLEEPSLRERVNEILLPDDDSIPDWDNKVDMNESEDPCCSEARELLATYISEKAQNEPNATMANAYMGLYEDIMRGGEDWSCEDIQWKMERWAQGSDWERKVGNAVLDAWNKCSEKTRLGDTTGTFTASKDGFEAGWGILIKEYSVYDGLPDDAPVEGLVTTHSGIGAPEVAAKRVGTKPVLSMDGWDQSIRTLGANHPGKHIQQWFSPDTLDDTLGHIHDATTGLDSWAFHGSPSCTKIAASNLHGKKDPHGAMDGMRFVGDVMDNIREWENPPSMMSVEQSPGVIPYMLDGRKRANQGISEDFKTMVRNSPTLTSSMFGSPTTRRRMWATEGTMATPTHTPDQYRSINDVLPHLAQEWYDSDTKAAELEHLRQSGRVSEKGLEYLAESPSLALLGSINPGKDRAVWNDDKKSMAFGHINRLDKPIHSLRHHGASLTHTRHLTPEEMLQIQGWTPEEAKAFNFPQKPSETYDVNAGKPGKKKNPNNVIRTQIGNTLSPNIYENLLRNVGLGQQRLY